ncbi:DUF3606 domain-containing protein [Chelatococcus reniformis]|uniref:DUF3606 domain-containing protein n=1 Tax=Chelatococcus reniformis TaxID=1494448 RepID=A0A916U6Y1_9HYPH|nr:DUF3606 domain-containing protein [Chelatococcus reniformis]GGC61466.1 hypothetical protein GCM10010994_20060 [Chelatococcus reniformis]
MTGDIRTSGGQERDALTGAGYDVDGFAERHGITTAKARELIQRFGHDRAKLEAEAAKLKTDR